MKTVAVIQAGGGSAPARPNALWEIAGRAMLWRVLERVARCAVDEAVVAVGKHPDDDAAAAVAKSFGAACFRSDEPGTLSSLLGAARQAKAEVIVRAPGDCPFFDAQVANRVIAELADHLASCDYAANVMERTYPRGLEVEAFTFGALSWMDRLVRGSKNRENAAPLSLDGLRRMLLCRSVKDDQDNSDLRWTVQDGGDLEVARRLYRELDLVARPAGYREIAAYVRRRADLLRPAAKAPRRAA